RLDEREFVCRQTPLPVEQLFWQADLADVVQQSGVEGDLLVLGVEADQPGKRLRCERDPVVERCLGLGWVLPLNELAEAFLGTAKVAPELLQPEQRPHPDLEVPHRDRLDYQVVAARLDPLRALRSWAEAGQ